MKRQHSPLLFALLLALPTAAAAGEPTGVEIVQKAWWAGKLDGAEMVSTLVIISDKGEKRVRKTAAISKLYDDGKTEKRLIRFLSPADVKGTGLLSFDYEKKDDDIWFFLPSLRKTRRIVAGEKSKNFMGSEFTYADMTPPSVEDFTHKLLRSERAGGQDCWVVESTPRTRALAEENGFSRRLAWFAKKDNIVRKARTFDLAGKPLRDLTAEKVEEIDPAKHRFRPRHMTMENLQTKNKSEMIIDQIKLRSEIPDKYFTERYLERF